MHKKTQYLLWITSGLLLMGLGFIYQILDLAGDVISLIFINAGLIIMVVAVLKYNRFGAGVVQDEMTRDISTQALSYSWLLTFVLVNMLFWIDYLQVVRLGSQAIFGIIIFSMLLSAAIFKKLLYINA